MKNWKLYVIVDAQACYENALEFVTMQTILGGADVIQYRDKLSTLSTVKENAFKIKTICDQHKIPFILNDYLAIAHEIDSSGVHLGQDDMSVQVARNLLGPAKIIGKSTHSKEQATQAMQEPLDYIGVGPVFSTPTKPTYTEVGVDLVNWVSNNCDLPFVAIGGIDSHTLQTVLNAGASTIAVVRAICSQENIKQATMQLKEKIEDITKIK